MGLVLAMEPRRVNPRVYKPYAGPERACDLCGPSGSHKRAIFIDTRQKRYLCARCTVAKIEAGRTR